MDCGEQTRKAYELEKISLSTNSAFKDTILK